MLRHYLFLIFIINLFAFLFTTKLSSQWVKTGGPAGGSIEALYVSGGTIYSGVYLGGIYKSTDNGNSWIFLALPGTTVSALTSDGLALFAATGDGIYRSTNNGLNWQPANNGLTNLSVTSLVVEGSTVFASTYGGVFKSINSGQNWICVFPNYSFITLVNSGGSIYAGSYDYGIFRSTNSGMNWVPLGLDTVGVTCIEITPTHIFVGSDGYGVFKSQTGQMGWEQENVGLTNTFVYSLKYDGTYIYAGTWGGGVFRKTVSGLSWSNVNNGLTHTAVYAFALGYPSNIFAGTDGGVFLSTNSGGNWTKKFSGMANLNVYALCAPSLVSPNKIFAGTSDGVALTTDDGITWSSINNGLSNLTVLTLIATDSALLAGTYGGGVFKTSAINPSSWNTINTGLNGGGLYINKLYKDFLSNIYAATYNGVYTYYNNQWLRISNGLGSSWVYSITSSGVNNLYAGTASGVYYSTNSGANWILVSALPSQVCYSLLTVGTSIYAAVGSSGVYVSNNSGNNWTLVGLSGQSVRDLKYYNNVLIAGTWGNGIFISTDQGANWTNRVEGLNFTYKNVYALWVQNSNLFAGFYAQSVWKRPFSELISGIAHEYQNVPQGLYLSQNYPNPFNFTTNISYVVPKTGNVRIAVYDMLGRQLKIIVNSMHSAGYYEIQLDASNFSSGLYIYKLEFENTTLVRKMLFLK
ncbi:MAG: T9SS type A sorting domain-containing protein [Ignavibacteria bacterium]